MPIELFGSGSQLLVIYTLMKKILFFFFLRFAYIFENESYWGLGGERLID